MIFWVVNFAIVHHFAGHDTSWSTDDSNDVAQKQITLHEWLFPALLGSGSFVFSKLLFFIYDTFNRGIDASILPEEREYFQRKHRLATTKAAVFAGMGVLLLAFIYYQNFLGCVLFMLVNLVLSFFGWEYWE